MSDVAAAVVSVALMIFHAAQAHAWASERARLVSAALAPTPGAAAALLVPPAPRPERDEAPVRRSVAIGNGGL